MLCNKKAKRNLIILLTAVMLVGAAPARADWVQLAKLTASDAAERDFFGYSVAISGSTALVGARHDDPADADPGSAYLYDVATGSQIAKLTASDAAAGDEFGFSVALSGTTAIVGARLDDHAAGTWSGSAYLYDFSDPCSIIETKLTASDAAAGDLFGVSVAISGTTAIVGAPYDESRSGSAYLFDFSDPCSITEIKLTASDAAAGDFFGFSVAISGATAIVGAWRDDDAGSQSGSAYLYDFSDPCNIIETKLTASDAAADDRFGISVAISGATALVGAYLDDDAGLFSNSGSAYLFDFSDPCSITEIKLTASDAAAKDNFGWSVAISGSTALVGARGNDAAGPQSSGSAYLYDVATGSQIAILTASDAAAFDWFGFRVALSGATAIVGAHRNDDACPSDPGCDSGSAYLFTSTLPPDSDGDGLSDEDEVVYGTDPDNPDTDGDGLMDGTEVDMAEGSGCPDPLNPDSDGDTLLDGDEVNAGTNPCNVDTDGDELTDDIDPYPLDPEVTNDVLEQVARTLCAMIRDLDLGLFNGPNNNANKGRRNALANRAAGAANAIADGDIDSAIALLTSLVDKIDGADPPPDWMYESPEKTNVAGLASQLIVLLSG